MQNMRETNFRSFRIFLADEPADICTMTETEDINYRRIEQAITFIREQFRGQPSLEEIAAHVHLSPAHFQRMFSEWAGVSPKKFLQYISVEHAKSLLKNKQATLFDTAYDTGLSGTSRLHDLFVTIEAMTPAEYRNGAKNLVIQYSFAETGFGRLIVASTEKGICHIAFENDDALAVAKLREQFPLATLIFSQNEKHSEALKVFSPHDGSCKIRLHLKGTEFQLKVWAALLKIPSGEVATYGKLAATIEKPSASRAVGTAIGSNPVAFIIPCHRVIQSTGNFGGYMWGTSRKAAMIGWENAKKSGE